jgi:triacylglycerol esterase/lipase EstA (alpha/beta hydrolase family)
MYVEKVNVVAHSKGGLDTREYLRSVVTVDINSLLMIGTPNLGSPYGKNRSVV